MHSALQLIEQISILPALGVRTNQISQPRGQNISLLMFGSETPGTHKMPQVNLEGLAKLLLPIRFLKIPSRQQSLTPVFLSLGSSGNLRVQPPDLAFTPIPFFRRSLSRGSCPKGLTTSLNLGIKGFAQRIWSLLQTRKLCIRGPLTGHTGFPND